MKVWPFVVALRREVTNHRLVHWLKTVVLSETEKAHMMRQVGIKKTVRNLGNEITVEVSLLQVTSKPECHDNSGMSSADIRLLAERCPAWRRRELDLLVLHGTWEGVA